MSLVLRCGWPEDEYEGGEEEVDDEGDELAVVGALDEGLPLGLQQVDHDALDQVEVLHLLAEHDQVQGGHQVDLACHLKPLLNNLNNLHTAVNS